MENPDFRKEGNPSGDSVIKAGDLDHCCSSMDDHQDDFDDCDEPRVPCVSVSGLTYTLKEKLTWGQILRLATCSRKVQPLVGDLIKGKPLLRGVTFRAYPGKILAVTGPSGAGKSTILDVLAGRIHPRSLTGIVSVQGATPRSACRIGYVTQEDTLYPVLTPRESLMFSTRVRTPSSVSWAKKAERVDNILSDLGLQAVADAQIGDPMSTTLRGMSGGERRRVSIGIELVHDPTLLLLDEPTTGLDSGSALKLASLLRTMADTQRRTIVLSIHQPSTRLLHLIDNLLLMAKGTVVYHGPTARLELTLTAGGFQVPERANALEFGIELLSGSTLEELEEMRRKLGGQGLYGRGNRGKKKGRSSLVPAGMRLENGPQTLPEASHSAAEQAADTAMPEGHRESNNREALEGQGRSDTREAAEGQGGTGTKCNVPEDRINGKALDVKRTPSKKAVTWENPLALTESEGMSVSDTESYKTAKSSLGGSLRGEGPLAAVYKASQVALAHRLQERPAIVRVLSTVSSDAWEDVVELTCGLQSATNMQLMLTWHEARITTSRVGCNGDPRYANSPWNEVLAICSRNAKVMLRAREIVFHRCLTTCLYGFLMGSLFFKMKNELGSIRDQLGFFAAGVGFLYANTMDPLPILLKERHICSKEATSHSYRILSYVIASILTYIPFVAAVAFLFGTPAYWLAGLPPTAPHFLFFILTCWAVIMNATAVVSFVAAMFPDFISASSMILSMFRVFFLFSGYFITNSDIPRYWSWMYYLSIYKYPLDALVINQYESNGNDYDVLGPLVLTNLGLTTVNKWIQLGILMSYSCLYWALCYVALCWRLRKRR